MTFSHRSIAATLAVLMLAAPAFALASGPDSAATADAAMTRAKTQAAQENKAILLSFDASWCGNCRLFDRFLADPAIHPIMDKAFVFVDLDTGEQPQNTHHSNIPGGVQLQDSLGGKNAGYPYIVVLDPHGTLLVDSKRPAALGHAGNIGYPVASYEIDWFIQMLKKAAPSLTPQDLETVQAWLTTHGTKH